MSTWRVKKYSPTTAQDKRRPLNLHILHSRRHWKNKQKVEEQLRKQKIATEEQGEKWFVTVNENIKKEKDNRLPFCDTDEDSKILARQRKIFEELSSKRTEWINLI